MDDLYGADAYLEAAYEDANGAALPEHLMHEESEDVYAGTAANDDPDTTEPCKECGAEAGEPCAPDC